MSPPQKQVQNEDTLYRRISPVGNPQESIEPILNQWVQQGHDVNHASLHYIVKQIRHYRRFKHALEISEWMTKRYMQVTAADVAIRLDLIAKVHGVEEAEKYFDNTLKKLRTLEVYGALLNCYAHAKCVDKAEDVMQKIRELGFASYSDSMTYNVLLNLYCRTGNLEKADALICEMEAKQIKFDSFTYSILLNTYGANSDIDGIEKLMTTMESDPELKISWMTYAVAAKQYLKAGLVDKALQALQKSEKLIGFENKRNEAFIFIIKVYAAAGKKDEVLRVWKVCKMYKLTNRAYMSVLPSILKLNDLDTAEKIFKEWETSDLIKDIRIPNFLITAYCKRGLVEKAEALLESIKMKEWQKPDSFTWSWMSFGYVKSNQMTQAVEAMDFSLLEFHPSVGWRPNEGALVACLKYLKEEGDTERFNTMVGSLKDKGVISVENREMLLEYLW